MFDSSARRSRGRGIRPRARGALALAALAVIHVVDLPGTLGPTPLVGFGYFGIIAAAVVTGGDADRPVALAGVGGRRRGGLLGDGRLRADPRPARGVSWVITAMSVTGAARWVSPR